MLWILYCESNTPCVLCYTQPQIPTGLNFPWDHSQPQLTYCSVPKIFFLLVMVCSSWMQHMCISVSVAFFQRLAPWLQFWLEHFSELGCSFSIAVSCFLPGLISVFLLPFKFHFFLGLVATEGLGLCLSLGVANLLQRA